jgi:hypothetical protein
MKFGRFTTAVVVLGLIVGSALSQEKPSSPDISLAESKHISPFPPKTAWVKFDKGHATIHWTKATSERIVCYEIYRSIDGGPMKKLGRAKDPLFVDNPPAGEKVSYAVAAIDTNDNVSRLRLAKPE